MAGHRFRPARTWSFRRDRGGRLSRFRNRSARGRRWTPRAGWWVEPLARVEDRTRLCLCNLRPPHRPRRRQLRRYLRTYRYATREASMEVPTAPRRNSKHLLLRLVQAKPPLPPWSSGRGRPLTERCAARAQPATTSTWRWWWRRPWRQSHCRCTSLSATPSGRLWPGRHFPGFSTFPGQTSALTARLETNWVRRNVGCAPCLACRRLARMLVGWGMV